MSILEIMKMLPSAISAGVAIIGAIGGVTYWWKNRNTQNALTAANQVAAGMVAAAELVPNSPQIQEYKETVKQVQTALQLEITKQAGITALAKSAVAGAGLGDPKANETSARNVADVADAILQSKEIALNRSELPEIPR